MKKFVVQNTVEEIASLRRFPGRPENIIRVVKIEVYCLLEQLKLEVFAQCFSEDNDAYRDCAISLFFLNLNPVRENRLQNTHCYART